MIFQLKAEGVTAYSECVTEIKPYYSSEDNDTSFHVIKDLLAEHVLALPRPKDFMNMDEISRIKGHNMAKAAMEMLLWDYHAKVQGIPLYKALGNTKGFADVGISIGMDEPARMAEKAVAAVTRGYKRIKVKIEKGKEDKILSAVRPAVPAFPLSADANSDYTLNDAPTLGALDKFNLVYLEQPLAHDDIIDHAELSKQMATPICLDESITSVDKARKAMQTGAARVVNIKPGRVGGLTESLAIAHLVREAGGHVWIGGMLETGIGRAFNVALASISDVDYPGDTSPNDKYFHHDIVKNPFKMMEGRIRPFESPGIGVEIDEQALAGYRLLSGVLAES